MYKKFLVVASKKDRAGTNIIKNLSQFEGGNFELCHIEGEIIYTENLDLDKINQYDFIIFASKHKSEKQEKTLSLHSPGNWRDNVFGGQKRKVCRGSALFQKQAFELLVKNRNEHHLNDYGVTLEATHHGPLIEKPCVFIEVGSTETEWTDRRAGFVVALTIKEVIEKFEENPYNEVAVAVGGPHYCQNFNKIQSNSNVAFCHVIPKYVLPLTKEIIKEAIEKTEEEVDFILLDWKGIGDLKERKNIIEILERNYIQWKKVGNV